MTGREAGLQVPRWEHGRVERAEVIQVIRVHHVKGEGANGDPIRQAFAYFDMEGNKMWEDDRNG